MGPSVSAWHLVMPKADLPDWNDLRDILLVAESGSLSGAARRSGVSQSTMSRRMAAIEAGGRPVFRRNQAGQLEPTPRGEALLRAARAMQAAVQAAEAELAERPAPIRLITCEVTARLFADDAVADWTECFDAPAELLVREDLAEVSASAYDINIDLMEAPPEGYAGFPIGEIEMGVYAAQSYLDRYPFGPHAQDLYGHRVIRASGSLADIPAFQWLEGLGGTVALLSQSPLAQLEACGRGRGVALLPTSLADRDSRLVGLDLPTCTVGRVWLVADANKASHPRLAHFLRWARGRFTFVRKATSPESGRKVVPRAFQPRRSCGTGP